jgi:hypothetical protein
MTTLKTSLTYDIGEIEDLIVTAGLPEHESAAFLAEVNAIVQKGSSDTILQLAALLSRVCEEPVM